MSHGEPTSRLLDGDAADPLARRAAEVLGAGDPAANGLHPALLVRLERRALAATPPPSARASRRRALALGIALVGAPVMAAAVARYVPHWLAPAEPTPVPAAPARKSPAVQAPAPAEPSPPPRAVQAVARSHHPSPVVALVPVPVPEVDAPRPSALAEEAREVRAALERLRVAGDPAGALVLLDAYGVRYPRGELASEAELARVEALLGLGRRSAALKVLDEMDGRQYLGVPRAAEMRVLRGELLAEAGRCAEALPAFGPLAEQADPVGERALYGRAGCRIRTGDEARGRADLETYLRAFPSGRYAADARRALQGP